MGLARLRRSCRASDTSADPKAAQRGTRPGPSRGAAARRYLRVIDAPSCQNSRVHTKRIMQVNVTMTLVWLTRTRTCHWIVATCAPVSETIFQVSTTSERLTHRQRTSPAPPPATVQPAAVAAAEQIVRDSYRLHRLQMPVQKRLKRSDTRTVYHCEGQTCAEGSN